MPNINDTITFNGGVADIETKSNKTKIISNTPSDAKYPTEKAVRDFVNVRTITEDTEFVFNGGNAENTFEPGLVVDTILDEESTNPIANRVVTQALNDKIGLTDLFNYIFPVGSIYTSRSPINPQETFGGAWVQIKDCFLWATGDTESITYTKDGETITESLAAGKKGGEAEHILTVEEMPSHAHNMNSVYAWRNGQGGHEIYTGQDGNLKVQDYMTSVNGEGEPHNNMPPYLSVYMWERIA